VSKNNEPLIVKPFVPSQPPSATSSTIPNPTNIPVPTVTTNVDNKNGNSFEGFASIKIGTIKRTRSYEIMPDVNENTLKKNIGWLPSSSLPDQEGLCILMGHRDTDFSILKYAEVGDEFIVSMNGFEFKYSVSAIEIVNSDNELRFKAHSGSTLLLVTCYPFRYSGHAPQKILFYATKVD
jgi:sortase A